MTAVGLSNFTEFYRISALGLFALLALISGFLSFA